MENNKKASDLERALVVPILPIMIMFIAGYEVVVIVIDFLKNI